MFDKSNLLVSAYFAKLHQGIEGSLVRDDDLPGLVGNSRASITSNKIFKADHKLGSVLSAIDKVGTNSTEEIAYKEQNPIKSNLSAMRVGLQIKKILIVDDEPDIIFTLRSVFEVYPERFQVSSYTNPMEVLGTFQTNYYDLALIDINMPVLNGFQLCEKLVDLIHNWTEIKLL